MTAPVTVSERDLRTLLGIVTEHRNDLPAAGLPMSLLTELKDQIPCDYLSFFGFDPAGQTCWFFQTIPEDVDDSPYEQEFWGNYWDFDPFTYYERTGDLRSVTKISDFYSARQFHNTGIYCAYSRPIGIEHHLTTGLPAGLLDPPGRGRRVELMLFRGPGRDFSERDRALLGLLRPHLHQAYLDAERRRRPTPQLTPRHWELLRLVAAGHTNAQIARRLDVTEKTVGKHLENIYARLQVSSRTAAVTRAFPDGPTHTAPTS
jgi:DNA-binding CsgD family transcriptional regulator